MTSRIRVLHPITRLIIGGAQENTMLTCDLLDKTEWQAEIVSGPQTGPEGSLIEEVRARGIPLYIEPTLVREINPLQDIRAFVTLYRLVRQNNYQIVHTHSSKAGILGRWAAWLAGAPIIVHTVHGWGHTPYQRPIVRAFYIALEKLTLRITDQLIAVASLDVDKGLSDNIGAAGDYVVIRSGIELDRFGHPAIPAEQVRAGLNIPTDAPVVGTVIRLSPQKAPLDFVRAAKEIADRFPQAKFVMVGDGPLRSDVEALIAELRLADRMILTGLRRDVPELMSIFDVFVLTSLWEGLPRVLPQAMAGGLPIVATAIDGNAEAIEDGISGRLVPPGDPAALTQAVGELLDDPTLAEQLAQAGRKRAAEFGAKKMVADIAAVYLALLEKKRKSDNF